MTAQPVWEVTFAIAIGLARDCLLSLSLFLFLSPFLSLSLSLKKPRVRLRSSQVKLGFTFTASLRPPLAKCHLTTHLPRSSKGNAHECFTHSLAIGEHFLNFFYLMTCLTMRPLLLDIEKRLAKDIHMVRWN